MWKVSTACHVKFNRNKIHGAPCSRNQSWGKAPIVIYFNRLHSLIQLSCFLACDFSVCLLAYALCIISVLISTSVSGQGLSSSERLLVGTVFSLCKPATWRWQGNACFAFSQKQELKAFSTTAKPTNRIFDLPKGTLPGLLYLYL